MVMASDLFFFIAYLKTLHDNEQPTCRKVSESHMSSFTIFQDNHL